MSIVLGMLASVLPNLFFKKLFYAFGKDSPKKIVNALYLGGACKYLGMALLVSLFLQLPNLNIRIFCVAIICSEVVRMGFQFISLRTTAR